MSNEIEIYTTKIQRKEWAKFETLVRDLMNGIIEPDDLWTKCFDEQSKLNLKLEKLEESICSGT